jgi:transposase
MPIGTRACEPAPHRVHLDSTHLESHGKCQGHVAVTAAMIEAAVPVLAATRDLFDRFQAMVRKRDPSILDTWLDDASIGQLASFALSLRGDQAAISAALSLPWSNGKREGHITKCKLVNRQMYGRAKLDLLRAQLLGAA